MARKDLQTIELFYYWILYMYGAVNKHSVVVLVVEIRGQEQR